MQSSGHRAQGAGGSPRKYPWRLAIIGGITLLTAIASGWFIYRSPAIYCDSLAPLTVLATLAAFLMSIAFRLMGRFPGKRDRWFLFACVLIAGATLFVNFRYVRKYRTFCDQLRQQIRQAEPRH
ncbi:MAG: hypothetical protein WBW84_22085 [Acidobacteriaceae bacterium]